MPGTGVRAGLMPNSLEELFCLENARTLPCHSGRVARQVPGNSRPMTLLYPTTADIISLWLIAGIWTSYGLS